MSEGHEIDFPVNHFSSRLGCGALVEICCWTVSFVKMKPMQKFFLSVSCAQGWYLIGQPNVNIVKIFCFFWSLWNLQKPNLTLIPWGNPKLLTSKKSLQVKIYRLVQIFLQRTFFLFIDILLKLQQLILIWFCKFSCNSVIVMSRATKINKVKLFLPLIKFMKRPQTKFHAHTISESQVIRSKKVKIYR